jgi:hypothetical protein
VPVYAHNLYDIAMAERKLDLDDEDLRAWQKEKLEAFRQWDGDYDTAIQAAYRAERQAWRHLIMATAEIDTPPTTPAGVFALLCTIADSYDCDDNDDGAWDGVVWERNKENGDTDGDAIVDNAGLLLRVIRTLADAAQSMQAAGAVLTEVQS